MSAAINVIKDTMEGKETNIRTLASTGIINDSEYFRYIFKKTEKIVCAVFYIVRSEDNIGQDDSVLGNLERTASAVLETALASLKGTERDIENRAEDVRHALITLESKLRVAHASRLLSTEFLDVFLHEIDTVQRSLKRYIEPKVQNPLFGVQEKEAAIRERKVQVRLRSPEASMHTGTPGVPQVGRRERVLNVLRDRGEATIKDIIAVINDCSEKTIQRELIALIKDNAVVREGERRWSKYKLV